MTRIIHKCGGSGRTLFDEVVTDENRHDQRFWEQPCAVAGGLFSIFLYKKPLDDEYWKAVRTEIKEKRSRKLLELGFPTLSCHTIDKTAVEEELWKNLRELGTSEKVLEQLRVKLKGNKLIMEIHGPSKLLSLLEEKLSKVVISGLLPQMKEYDVDDEGEKIEPKIYVTTFGPENQSPNCQPSIIVKQVSPKSQNKLAHYVSDEAGN